MAPGHEVAEDSGVEGVTELRLRAPGPLLGSLFLLQGRGAQAPGLLLGPWREPGADPDPASLGEHLEGLAIGGVDPLQEWERLPCPAEGVPSVCRSLAAALEGWLGELERAQQHLRADSEEMHRARGVAEISSSVLHNVSNVLGAATTSGAVIGSTLRQSRVPSLLRLGEIVAEHADDLPEFVRGDEQGRKLGSFLPELARVVGEEWERMREEAQRMARAHDHIRQVVAVQQNYGASRGIEAADLAELVQDALQLFDASFERHHVQITVEGGEELPLVPIERHSVLQIVINLLKNARDAVRESPEDERRIRIRLGAEGSEVWIRVEDNGVGIEREAADRLFDYGFTTKTEGHGFGLHGSLAAAERMGGRLEASSDGPGRGAAFTLRLPREAGS
jgi:signal transduction histidine kinase